MLGDTERAHGAVGGVEVDCYRVAAVVDAAVDHVFLDSTSTSARTLAVIPSPTSWVVLTQTLVGIPRHLKVGKHKAGEGFRRVNVWFGT